MLKKQVDGLVDSWAIKWYASAFLENKVTLYPGKSLVRNIGNDNSGTHSKLNHHFDTLLSDEKIILEDIVVANSQVSYDIYTRYFRRLNNNISIKKIFHRIISFIK
jgi:hypothetical protein